MNDSPQQRFLALLVALMLLFVVCPVVRTMYRERFLYDGLLTIVFVAALSSWT